jgi:hypothetical protein
MVYTLAILRTSTGKVWAKFAHAFTQFSALFSEAKLRTFLTIVTALARSERPSVADIYNDEAPNSALF